VRRIDPTKQLPTKKERNTWSQQPKWTTRIYKKGLAVVIPWSKQGQLMYVEIYNSVVNERKIDREKGANSVEMRYMRELKEKLDIEAPDRKRRKICMEEDDVKIPIHDMAGNLLLPVEVIGV
jgi:hypothetical protein